MWQGGKGQAGRKKKKVLHFSYFKREWERERGFTRGIEKGEYLEKLVL